MAIPPSEPKWQIWGLSVYFVFGALPISFYSDFNGGFEIWDVRQGYFGFRWALSIINRPWFLFRYRKSPMYKYPVMKDDCVVATTHFLESLDVYGVDPARVVTCGDSVGGTAATVTSQMLVHRPDLPRIKAQILIYPLLQLIDFGSPSYQQNRNIPLLSWDLAFYCFCCHLDVNISWKSVVKNGMHLPPDVWEKYRKWLGAENIPERFKNRGYKSIPWGPVNNDAYQEIKRSLNYTCSPLISEDSIVSQLPETCIVSCEYDLLRDHSLLYKKRLEDLGVPVTWHHMEDGFHGVLSALDYGLLSFPCASRIMDLIIQFIRKFWHLIPSWGCSTNLVWIIK